MPLSSYEREAIRLLVGPELDPPLLSYLTEVAEADSVEHTGAGYFLTIVDPRLPRDRRVFSTPTVVGRCAAVECGFVCFVEGGELTLECHSWGDGPIPIDIRTRVLDVAVVAAEGGG